MMRKLLFAMFAAILIIGMMAVPAAAAAPPDADVQAAIDNGLAWLATQQNPVDGSWISGGSYSDPPAATGLVLTKFCDRAYEKGLDPFVTDPADPLYYPYSLNVIAGFSYLFNNVTYDSINSLVYFASSLEVYDTSMPMMALATSRKPAFVVGPGPCTGLTYQVVLQDMENWLVNAQSNDGTLAGGWGYNPTDKNNWADQSNTGYAAMALGFAQAPLYTFGIPVPAAVTDNLSAWSAAVQVPPIPPVSDNGGSWYGPNNFYGFGANTYRTGSLLYELGLTGKNSTSPEVQAAVGFIGNAWGNPAGEGDMAGWMGNYQAMFTLMKGMQSLGIDQITVGGTPQPWFDDVATYILANAIVVDATHSYWNSIYDEPSGYPVLSTAWALLTLEKAVPPVVGKTDTTTTTKLLVNKKACAEKKPVITLGQSVQDRATVTGVDPLATVGPTGNVTFEWSNDGGGTWNPLSTNDLTPIGAVKAMATSDLYLPLGAGDYLFRANL